MVLDTVMSVISGFDLLINISKSGASLVMS